MTNIETALQKTVGFGCKEFAEKAECVIDGTHGSYEEMLLDPTVWRDVAKAEGWGKIYSIDHPYTKEWQYKIHLFLDALIEQV